MTEKKKKIFKDEIENRSNLDSVICNLTFIYLFFKFLKPIIGFY